MNGAFQNWVFGITAGLVLLAVSGGIWFDREMAQRLSQQDAEIRSIMGRIEDFKADQRFTGVYNRNDAERDLMLRDQAIEKLNQRVQKLEQK
jgi:hypothetical protein